MQKAAVKEHHISFLQLVTDRSCDPLPVFREIFPEIIATVKRIPGKIDPMGTGNELQDTVAFILLSQGEPDAQEPIVGIVPVAPIPMPTGFAAAAGHFAHESVVMGGHQDRRRSQQFRQERTDRGPGHPATEQRITVVDLSQTSKRLPILLSIASQKLRLALEGGNFPLQMTQGHGPKIVTERRIHRPPKQQHPLPFEVFPPGGVDREALRHLLSLPLPIEPGDAIVHGSIARPGLKGKNTVSYRKLRSSAESQRSTPRFGREQEERVMINWHEPLIWAGVGGGTLFGMGLGALLFRRRSADTASSEEGVSPLEAACSLTHDALFLVEQNRILFANPAAERLGEIHAPALVQDTEEHLKFYDTEEKQWFSLEGLLQRHRRLKTQANTHFSSLELDPEKRTKVTVDIRSVTMQPPGERPRTSQLVSIHDAHCEKQLFDLRHLNTLTGLPNQFKAFSDITMLTARGDERSQFAILMIELDDPSRLRSMLGYAEMDTILGHIARVLREMSDGERIRVYHLHYVTFMVLIQRPHGDEAIYGFMDRFQQQLQQSYSLQNNRQKLTFSTGVSFYPRHRSLYNLINSAFAALTEAQEQGRGHTVLASQEIDRRIDRDINLNTELEKGIANRDLKLYFQPIYDGRTERLAGAEVLLRWHHPEKGIIMPDLFIPVAEKSGLILQIGQYVIEESLKQLSRWHSFGFPPLQLSVNISLRELENQEFMSSLIRLLYHYEFGDSRLKFEITEHAAMLNPNAALQRLKDIRQLGIGISLDDFGTGYSSFAYLAEFPIETLKIDRGFVTGMTRDSSKRHIVSTIIKLGHSLGMTIVAEGVENKEEATLLRSYGADYLQGYYYDRPLHQLEFQYLQTHPRNP